MNEEHDKLELMKTVAKRPGMWGVDILSEFFHFMMGCSAVWRSLEIGDLFGPDFQQWVGKKYRGGPAGPSVHWCCIILLNWGDDREGIEKFVVLYDEFISRRVTATLPDAIASPAPKATTITELDKLELMKGVAKRPGMWGLFKFSDFFHFMEGCGMAWRSAEVGDLFDRDFSEWVSQKFLRRSTACSWSGILVLVWGDDEEGIQKFVELHDEFRNSRVA